MTESWQRVFGIMTAVEGHSASFGKLHTHLITMFETNLGSLVRVGAT